MKKDVITKKEITHLVENTLSGEENLPYYVNKGNAYLAKLNKIKSNVYNKVINATVIESIGEIDELDSLAKNLYGMYEKSEVIIKELYDYMEQFDVFDRSQAMSDFEYKLIGSIESTLEDITNLSSAIDGLVEAAKAIKSIDDLASS